MKIVLVFEDLFLSCPTGFRQKFWDLRVLKIDSLSSDTPSSQSSFTTCPSIAHNVKSTCTLSLAFCCCTSPKLLYKSGPQGIKERKKCPKKQGPVVFIYEDAIVLVYEDLPLTLFMQTISVYRPAPLLVGEQLICWGILQAGTIAE